MKQPPGNGHRERGSQRGLGGENQESGGPGNWKASAGGPAPPEETSETPGQKAGEVAAGRSLVTRAVGARGHEPDEEG